MGKEKIQLGEDVQEAIKRFRGTPQDQTTECFLVLGYANGSKNEISVLAEGAGGLEDVKAAGEMFPSNDATYTLLRKSHQVEMAKTVKYAAVFWLPDSAPPMRKALLSTHKGQMEDILKPYHVNIVAGEASDLKEDEIMDKIGFSSGTKSQVTTKKAFAAIGGRLAAGAFDEQTGTVGAAARATSNYQGGTSGDLVKKEAQSAITLQLEDEDAIRSALQAVRSDAAPEDWCLVHYVNDKTLGLVGQGSGGVDEMVGNLTDQEVFYGLFRITEQIDKSTTVKFGFVNLMPEKNVSAIKRGKISTHQGFVSGLFSPFTTDFNIDAPDGLSFEIAKTKFGKISGTSTNVTDKAMSTAVLHG